jgi:hypothetical protein
VNSSKKLQPKKIKKVKLSEKPIKSISKPWLITSLILVAVLIGALLFDQLYEPALMTVDGKKYHMKDLSYYFYTVESGYSSLSQLTGNANYWDMTYDAQKGTTMRDAAKETAIDTSLRTEILYNEAVKQGYKLTADEEKTVSSNAKKIIDSQLPKEVIKKNHFTQAYLTKVLGKSSLVSRYRKDQIKAQNIDEDKIKAGISQDDYKQYEIEYIFSPTQKTDASGNAVEMSDAEKTAANDKIKGIYDKAKAASDWSKLLPSDETELTYKDTKFLEKNDSSSFSDDFKAMMMKMNNGDVSEIFTEKNGYYIVRMKNNKATDAYDSAVSNAISNAESTAFDNVYQKVKTEHKYKLNSRAIKALKMGNLTLAE